MRSNGSTTCVTTLWTTARCSSDDRSYISAATPRLPPTATEGGNGILTAPTHIRAMGQQHSFSNRFQLPDKSPDVFDFLALAWDAASPRTSFASLQKRSPTKLLTLKLTVHRRSIGAARSAKTSSEDSPLEPMEAANARTKTSTPTLGRIAARAWNLPLRSSERRSACPSVASRTLRSAMVTFPDADTIFERTSRAIKVCSYVSYRTPATFCVGSSHIASTVSVARSQSRFTAAT
mmetsp:Transcript_7966/g.24846  ORF Transcript_7966/g.24846 Transcript_7966/m.24846 type:complete len:235 (-) Transcript_7966:1439-2143(-)